MTNAIDKEIEAIKILLVTLEPLDENVRVSVVSYVLDRLGIILTSKQQISTGEERISQIGGDIHVEGSKSEHKEIHIKDLKEEKKPRSAMEMSVLVAYYVSNKAPKKDRKNFVNVKDLEMYFKIAGFRLPTQMHHTAFRAIKAGYLDSAGTGRYKLNPVGYNLVTHSMPILGKVSSQKSKQKKKKKKSVKKRRS